MVMWVNNWNSSLRVNYDHKVEYFTHFDCYFDFNHKLSIYSQHIYSIFFFFFRKSKFKITKKNIIKLLIAIIFFIFSFFLPFLISLNKIKEIFKYKCS